jgi:hypothetical protein
VPEPIATWNSARGVWERPETSLLCGHQVPFSEIWPTSGMTVSGRLYPLPALEPRTAASASSSSPGLLPTPMAADGGLSRGSLGGGGAGGFGLRDAVRSLLPTPAARDWKSGQSNIMDRNARPLSEVIETGLLKTPTAQLAVNGGSQHPDKRRAGGHGPTLADQVEHELLPTPRATDGTKGGPNQRGPSGDLMLPSAVMELLPTPRAARGASGTETMYVLGGERDDTNRPQGEVLLPTPTARLGDDTSRGADPARYKGPQSLNGRRSNLDDCIAAVETQAPWLSPGEPTSQPSADGNAPPDGWHQAQLSLDGLDPG